MIDNDETLLGELLNSSTSSSGNEEIFKVATKYARQLTAEQIKILTIIEFLAGRAEDEKTKKSLEKFVSSYLEYKTNHHTDNFVMGILRTQALMDYIQVGSASLDVKKQLS